ncbi:MAG: hypothetical protein AAFP89_25695 [Bacteroidota bacterium]
MRINAKGMDENSFKEEFTNLIREYKSLHDSESHLIDEIEQVIKSEINPELNERDQLGKNLDYEKLIVKIVELYHGIWNIENEDEKSIVRLVKLFAEEILSDMGHEIRTYTSVVIDVLKEANHNQCFSNSMYNNPKYPNSGAMSIEFLETLISRSNLLLEQIRYPSTEAKNIDQKIFDATVVSFQSSFRKEVRQRDDQGIDSD